MSEDQGPPPDDQGDSVVLTIQPIKRTRKRQSVRLRQVRAVTTAVGEITREELAAGALMFPPINVPRPKTLADCMPGGMNEARPCPWVSCKKHLYLDINEETGSIKINFPDKEPWELKETCSEDVAHRGGSTLDEVGEIMNLTRERIRQMEMRALARMKLTSPSEDELGANIWRRPGE